MFILLGFICAIILTGSTITNIMLKNLLAVFLSTSIIASANYVINEWLDAEFDKFHLVKQG